MAKYIFIDENNHVGFKVDGIHEILETDVPISDENYNRFFKEQSEGKSFEAKNIDGLTFEEIFKELQPKISPSEPSEIDYLIDLDFRLSKIELGI